MKGAMFKAGGTKNNSFYLVFVFLLIIFHGACNYAWLKHNDTLSGRDEPIHANIGLTWVNILRDFLASPSAEAVKSHNINDLEYYPPLFYLSSSVLSLIFGCSYPAMAMTNTLYLGVLILAVYGIGCRMRGSQAGLLAAFLVSMYPAVFGSARNYTLELPLAACLALSCCVLAYIDFGNVYHGLVLGAVLGAGSLSHRIFFPLFISCPLVYALYLSFAGNAAQTRHNKGKIIRLAGMLLISLSLAVLIARPFYWNWLKLYGQWMISAKFEDLTFFQRVADAFLFYPLTLWESCLYPLLCAIALAAFFWFARSKNNYKLFLLYWIIPPFLAFSFISHKIADYLVPVLAPLALISALGILHMNFGRAKKAVVILIVLLSLAQFAALSFLCRADGNNMRLFSLGPLPSEAILNTRFFRGYVWQSRVFAYPPAKYGAWDEVCSFINKDGKSGQRRLRVGVISEDFNSAYSFKYFMRLRDPRALVLELDGASCFIYMNDWRGFDYLVYINERWDLGVGECRRSLERIMRVDNFKEEPRETLQRVILLADELSGIISNPSLLVKRFTFDKIEGARSRYFAVFRAAEESL